mmetsp:Transcript_102606/g.328753  ORF Transcript_102606/g.328753 Transcript_102606/m.328753 type:complete len:335 (+) Transcript_102606:1399-2403(+)
MAAASNVIAGPALPSAKGDDERPLFVSVAWDMSLEVNFENLLGEAGGLAGSKPPSSMPVGIGPSPTSCSADFFCNCSVNFLVCRRRNCSSCRSSALPRSLGDATSSSPELSPMPKRPGTSTSGTSNSCAPRPTEPLKIREVGVDAAVGDDCELKEPWGAPDPRLRRYREPRGDISSCPMVKMSAPPKETDFRLERSKPSPPLLRSLVRPTGLHSAAAARPATANVVTLFGLGEPVMDDIFLCFVNGLIDPINGLLTSADLSFGLPATLTPLFCNQLSRSMQLSSLSTAFCFCRSFALDPCPLDANDATKLDPWRADGEAKDEAETESSSSEPSP